MSDELNKEMEEVVEATAKPTGVSAKAPSATKTTMKLKQEPENMQKAPTTGSSNTLKAKGDAKSAKTPAEPYTSKTKMEETEMEDQVDQVEETVEESEEVIQEMPKLKSDMLDGLVAHMKGLKKEELAALYSNTLMTEEDEEEEEEEDEDEDEKEAEESKKVAKESIDQVVDSLDVSDDVSALVDGEELSEEFKTKAATIFESAVKSKVRTELERIQEENDKVIEEMAESTINDMTEKVDDYLNYVVEQWMEENQLAIERGLKGEIAEDFISGLKNLFEDHYIDVPDEKYDILEANLTRIEELEEKLNKQMDENIQLKKAKGELVKESMIADVANGMTDTETEKFQSLVEDVEFSDEESYTEKLQTIRESYFGSKEVLTEEGSEPTSTEPVQEVSKSMEKYLKAIGRDEARAKK
jgi:hypothetical protein